MSVGFRLTERLSSLVGLPPSSSPCALLYSELQSIFGIVISYLYMGMTGPCPIPSTAVCSIRGLQIVVCSWDVM